MNHEDVARHGEELHAALRAKRTVAPLTERVPGITVDDAYRIQLHLVGLRKTRDGERVIGKKIGLTSEVVRRTFGVDEPDFGHLMDSMALADGASVPTRELIQPRAEGEIAFVLARDLAGPGIRPEDVLPATECLRACFEIVDSRIHDWKIKVEDTVADNASSGMLVVGREKVSPGKVDLLGCRMTLEKNGAPAGRGVGAASMGDPRRAVAWLANVLGAHGIVLRAGEIVLSGSLGPLVPVRSGDSMRLAIEGLGGAAVAFA